MFELFCVASSLVRVRSGSPNVPVFELQQRVGTPSYSSESSTRTGTADATARRWNVGYTNTSRITSIYCLSSVTVGG